MKNSHTLRLLLCSGLIVLCNCGRFDTVDIPKVLSPNAILHVDIESSVQSTFINQQHLEVPVQQLFGEGLKLKPLVTLKGSAPVDAEIVAFAKLDGLLKSTGNLSADIDNHGLFSLKLVASQKYYLVVNPSGRAQRPPAYFEISLDSDATGQYESQNHGTKISGVLKSERQIPLFQFADKIWIRVMQDNHQVSSLGRINEHGEFGVILSNPLFKQDLINNPLELWVEHASDLNFLATKRITLPLKSANEDTHVGIIDLGPSQPLVKAHVALISAEDTPVREARLIVRSLVQDGFVQATTMSDSHGVAQILIPMGKYDVAIVPKHDDPVGFKKIKDVEFANATPINIHLEKRAEVKIQISDAHSTPVTGAQVLLSRFAKADSNTRENILDAAELRLEGRTNDQGRVCLLQISVLGKSCLPIRMDSGRYRVIVIPAEGSPYPYFTKVFDFPETSELAITLKKAIPLRGKLIGSSSDSLVPRSFIRIFAPEIEKESGIPIFLSQAFSQKDGTFSVVIPQEFAFCPKQGSI